MTTAEAIPTVSDVAPPLLPQRRTPCLARLDASRWWRPVRAYTLGGQVVGIRCGTRAAEELLDGRFSARRTPDHDRRARPNLSLEVPEGRHPGRRDLHLLYRDHVVVARRRTVEELLTDLEEVARSLEQLGGSTPVVQASVLLGPYGSATLLPAGWQRVLVQHQRRLGEEGLRVLPTREHLIETGHETALLRAGTAGGSTRHVVARWGVRWNTDGIPWLRAAEAVMAAFPTVVRTDRCGAREALRFLASVVPQVPVLALPAADGSSEVALARHLATS